MKTRMFPIKRGTSLGGAIAALSLAFLVNSALWTASCFAQTLPLDDKAKYEKSLEIKAEEVLMKLLGPNQAKVVVQAIMDFTRIEKLDVTSAGGAKGNMFKWQESSPETKMFSEYLLPGFPDMTTSGGPENTSYQRQMLFPASLIKKLTVTVILNKNLSDAEAQAVRNVVSEILSMDTNRGDQLIVIKTPFAPFWRTIWYTPEAMNLVFKYGILTVMGIVAMIVVAIGFLKLAGAMNTMAKAQQSHQITMDLGKGIAGLPGSPGGVSLPGVGGPMGKLELGLERPSESGAEGEEKEEKVTFNVRLDQVPFMVHLLSSEDPGNIALVATHLEPDVRSEFLRMLPPDVSSEVISNMVKVRFVEPDVIATIKDELERRLSGAVGGVSQVVEMLENVKIASKREMLSKLERRDPETARAVRKKIFMPEDLDRLSDRDMSTLISNFKIEVLSLALWEMPQAIKDKVKSQMAEKTWQMVEQTMKYGAPSRDQSEEAVEELVAAAIKLMKEGKITNPLLDQPALISNEPRV